MSLKWKRQETTPACFTYLAVCLMSGVIAPYLIPVIVGSKAYTHVKEKLEYVDNEFQSEESAMKEKEKISDRGL